MSLDLARLHLLVITHKEEEEIHYVHTASKGL